MWFRAYEHLSDPFSPINKHCQDILPTHNFAFKGLLGFAGFNKSCRTQSHTHTSLGSKCPLLNIMGMVWVKSVNESECSIDPKQFLCCSNSVLFSCYKDAKASYFQHILRAQNSGTFRFASWTARQNVNLRDNPAKHVTVGNFVKHRLNKIRPQILAKAPTRPHWQQGVMAQTK